MNPTTRSICHAASLLLLIVYMPLVSFSQPEPDSSQAQVDQLADRLALKNRLEEAPGNIRLQFEQNPLNLPAQENEQMLELFSEAYSTDRLFDDFKAALAQKMTGRYAEKIPGELDDPDIRAVTEARRGFYTLQGKRNRIISKYEMARQAPGQERAAVIAALVDTTSAASESVESSIIILRSVIKALGNISEQHKFTEQQVDAVVNNFRTQMQAGASRQTSDRLMVTYYNVDSDALESYLTFMQSDAGQWLDKAISQSMRAAYEEASKRFLKAVDTE